MGLGVRRRPGACARLPATTLPSHLPPSRCRQANPYRVAVHPFNGSKAVVAARAGLPLSYTTDYGATWANSSGGVASTGMQGNFWFGQPLAVDQQGDAGAPDATVYFYNGTTTLWVSADTGASFAPVYEAFPSWNVPFFGIATPPRGAAAAGDIWAFAGWKLYHRRGVRGRWVDAEMLRLMPSPVSPALCSVNGGANFSNVWQFYHPQPVIAVGPPPAVRSSRSGRGAGELAALCAASARDSSSLPPQPPTSSGASAGGSPRRSGRARPGPQTSVHALQLTSFMRSVNSTTARLRLSTPRSTSARTGCRCRALVPRQSRALGTRRTYWKHPWRSLG